MSTTIAPDIPGRGAWTQIGGLLRLKPGSTNRTGYYRLNDPTVSEVMVGAAGGKPGATYSQVAVHLGVVAFQRRFGGVPDGYFGRLTDAALRAFQEGNHLLVDGILGPVTARAIFRPLVTARARATGVPTNALGGIAALESSFDPGAVGANGVDTGLCQINLGAHDITMANAADPEFALTWTASELLTVHDRWVGKTTVDPWKIAIAYHNSPLLAQRWAETGVPPFSQFRADHGFPQIDQYVAKVLAAWGE